MGELLVSGRVAILDNSIVTSGHSVHWQTGQEDDDFGGQTCKMFLFSLEGSGKNRLSTQPLHLLQIYIP